jgi:hypothetical protein
MMSTMLAVNHPDDRSFRWPFKKLIRPGLGYMLLEARHVRSTKSVLSLFIQYQAVGAPDLAARSDMYTSCEFMVAYGGRGQKCLKCAIFVLATR